MKHYLAGKDYLGLLYYTPEQMMELVEIAQDLKRKWVMGEPHAYLRDKAFAMVFEKKSTRTRNSFHSAACALGAQSFYLRPDELQTSRGESIADTGRILDRYFDGLYIRTFGQEIVEEFAQNMKHPVINALTSLEHPCQALCDLLTIKEKKGGFKGVKICYAGDVYNVCNSLLLGATMFGMDMSIAAPEGYDVPDAIWKRAEKQAEISGSKIEITQNFDAALRGADVVYGNTWHSMGENEDEKDKRIKDWMPYQINGAAMRKADKNAIFMHCLPGYLGEDMTEDVKEGPQSVIFDQGENRMHAVKAILVSTCIRS